MSHSAEDHIVVPLRRRPPVVAIMAERGDRHASAIARYLRARGASAHRISLKACRFDSSRPHGMVLPGLNGALPDAVVVRAISAGSFEQVTMRLGILHALQEAGVTVWNTARAIERCVDKSTTSHVLARAGLPVPQTWSIDGLADAGRLVARETARGPLVLKPLFGAQGRGVRLIERAEDLPAEDDVAGIYHLQRFVGDAMKGPFVDYRLFVVGNHVVAAMERRSAHWVTNVRQGGEPVALRPEREIAALALAAAEAVGTTYCGVDILPGRNGPVVLEVNSMPAWSGLQKVAKPRISAAIANALMDELMGEGRRSAAG